MVRTLCQIIDQQRHKIGYHLVFSLSYAFLILQKKYFQTGPVQVYNSQEKGVSLVYGNNVVSYQGPTTA